MRYQPKSATWLAAILASLTAAAATAADLGPGFTYQGKVVFEGGTPPWSEVDVRCRLLDGDTLVQVPGSTQSISLDVPLNDGIFTTTVNALGEFGPNAFDGSTRKLEVELFFDPNIVVTFPPQDILATPYSQYADNGAGAWQTSGSDIYYDQGNVGIGTTTFTDEALAVGGRTRVYNAGETRSLQTWVGTSGAVIDAENAHLQLRTDGTDRIFINQAGNVGIGATSPGALLQVGTGDARMYVGRDPSLDLRKDTTTQKFRIQAVGNNYGNYLLQLGRDDGTHDITMTGNVGIGLENPAWPLEVDGGIVATNPSNAPDGSYIRLASPGSDVGITLGQGDGAGGELEQWNIAIESDSKLEVRDGNTDRMVFDTNGNVGIGANPPGERLHVGGSFRLDGDLRGYESGGDETVDIDTDNGGAPSLSLRTRSDSNALFSAIFMDAEDGATDRGARIFVRNSLGNTTVDIDGDISDAGCIEIKDNTTTKITLDANWQGSGDSRIITDVLQINGADLSEQFDITGDMPIEAGLVVSIDPANPGKLIVATDAYDKKVAGIVSGAGGVRTGLLMGQEGTLASGEHAVALTGRVWCYVDASLGAIEPGDLLTTSSTPGHAMKAADDRHSRGAVIGKAMTGLDSGTGMVLVLVQPQ